jgi:4-hydroxybenzoate polyprenyltransferase
MLTIWTFAYTGVNSDVHFNNQTIWNGFLLILSITLIAAAGNIINDVYDVEADKINKPQKMIVGVYLSAKKALVLCWIFNLTALIINGYLSFTYKTFFFGLSSIILISFLLFYSYHWKKVFLFGNVLIALMTAFIPVLALAFVVVEMQLEKPSVSNSFTLLYLIVIVIFYALFAFLLNLAREIIKDVLDIEGDKIIQSKSLAIKYGTSKALKRVRIILIITGILLLGLTVFLGGLMWLIELGLTLFFIIKSILKLQTESLENIKASEKFIKLSFLPMLIMPILYRIIYFLALQNN